MSSYRSFEVSLARRERRSSGFVRITLTGADLGTCSPTLLDQRVKLIFGTPTALDHMIAAGDNWYAALLAMGSDRPLLRTYTLVAVRPATTGGAGEVDIDVAVHEVPAPGSQAPGMRFALEAPLGTRTVLVAADLTREGHDRAGVAWRKEPCAEVVLVADETAVPAAVNILASLPDTTIGRAVFEVSHADDARPVTAPVGVRIDWRVRDRGERAVEVFAAAATLNEPACEPANPAEAEPEVLWDEADGPSTRRVWVAGEATWVKKLRAEAKAAGIGKHEASFMGYWKQGVTLT